MNKEFLNSIYAHTSRPASLGFNANQRNCNCFSLLFCYLLAKCGRLL